MTVMLSRQEGQRFDSLGEGMCTDWMERTVNYATMSLGGIATLLGENWTSFLPGHGEKLHVVGIMPREKYFKISPGVCPTQRACVETCLRICLRMFRWNLWRRPP